MKKLTLVVALVIAFASMTYAQKNGTMNVTVNAKIVQGLVLGSISGPLNFGDAQNTIVKGAVGASDTVITVTSDARAPYFSVTGDGGESITVTYTTPQTLNGSVSGSITYDATTQWTSSTTQTGGTTFASGASISLGGSLYSSSARYIWLGGDLKGTTTAPSGLYTGTFVITVAYTNL